MCGRTAVSGDAPTISRRCTYQSSKNSKNVRPNWHVSKPTGSSDNSGSSKQSSDTAQNEVENCESVFQPNYNIGPQAALPVLVAAKTLKTVAGGQVSLDKERVLVKMQWGLKASTSSNSTTSYHTFNCRIEGMTSSNLFVSALRKGYRCVIVVDGFYEWTEFNSAEKGKEKQPYFVHFEQPKSFSGFFEKQDPKEPDRKMLFLAGLFNPVIDSASGNLNFTCTVITMESAPSLKWLHHRMPAILPDEKAISDWLDCDSVLNGEAVKMLQPFDKLQFYPVSKSVGNIKVNEENNLKKVATKRASTVKSSKCMESWLKVAKK